MSEFKYFGFASEEDMKLARDIGTKTVEKYGTEDEVTFFRIMNNGIWNDHPAVQASLETIRRLKYND